MRDDSRFVVCGAASKEAVAFKRCRKRWRVPQSFSHRRLHICGKMVMALMLMGLQLFLLVVQEIVDFLALEHLFGVRQTLVEVMLPI